MNPETDVVSCLILSGQFERLNQMIGMENALCSFYEYPDELHEFFDAMLEYKLKCIDLAHKYLNPDVIHMHDDWGTNDNMFFSPELWREYIKPNEEKITQHIHELGMLYIHHSCGYIKQIIPDLVEIGVDAFAHKGRYIPYYIPSMEKKWFIYMDAVREYGQTIFQK